MIGRVLGADPGGVRTGVALSDAGGSFASGLCTIVERDPSRLADKIATLTREKRAVAIVIGYPVNMDGSRSNRAGATEALGALLRERLGEDFPIHYQDERRTTMEAHEILTKRGVSPARRRRLIDTLSAEIILQEFLDSQNKET